MNKIWISRKRNGLSAHSALYNYLFCQQLQQIKNTLSKQSQTSKNFLAALRPLKISQNSMGVVRSQSF